MLATHGRACDQAPLIQAQIDWQHAHGTERLWVRTQNKIRSAIPHFRTRNGKGYKLSASQRLLGSFGWKNVTYDRPVITKACFSGISQKSLHPKACTLSPYSFWCGKSHRNHCIWSIRAFSTGKRPGPENTCSQASHERFTYHYS